MALLPVIIQRLLLLPKRCHSLISLRQKCLDCWPLRHSVNPCLQIREILRLIILNNLEDARLPSDECEIGKRALISHQIFATLEHAVQDA